MTTQQLNCFVKVADKLSFTRAAQELFFSVSTVTHHIQMLESELQTQLFVRNRKMVALTQAGKIFYPDAKAMLLQMQLAQKRLKENASASILKIGCTSHAELVMLTDVLTVFHSAWPQIQPHIVIDAYDRLLGMTEEMQLDFMLASVHVSKHSDASFLKLGVMKTYAVVPEPDPLSVRESISFSELENRRLLLPDQNLIPFKSDNPIRDLVDLHSLHHEDILLANDQVCLSMVRAGYGVAVLPGYRIPSYSSTLGLSKIPVEENEDFAYGILYERTLSRDYEAWFLERLQEKVRILC